MRLRAIGAGLVVTLILLAAVALCIRYGPAWIVGDAPGLTPVERLKAENDARSALVQGFVGFLALGGATLGVVATIGQVRANRRGRATDLFIKAIELLGDERTQIRMGGVYALEQLAGEDADKQFHGHSHALLTAFVRQRVPWPNGDEPKPVPDDVGAALAVLSRQSVILEGDGSELESVDLRGAELNEFTIPNVCFAHANLEGAKLAGARFAGATMADTDLRGADLSKADLSKADFTGAKAAGANLSGANLRGADLSGADFRDADLSRANLRGADLRGADLSRANLRGADLRGADLTGADLTGADLGNAQSDAGTRWPEGFSR